MSQIRLQKFMADKGIASRRKCEEFIKGGMVKVNGEVITEMGIKIDPENDVIEVDGEKLKTEEDKYVYYALNKPIGYVSAAQQTANEKNIVTDLVPKEPRVFPVGRLDKDTTGLIILTNDGRLTFELTHPSQEHEKEYEVEVNPDIAEGALEKLRQGVPILGQKTLPTEIKRISKNQFKIVLKEGKNRHIRRICRKVGFEVVKLKRIRIGQFQLKNIPLGEYIVLKSNEVEKLKKLEGKI